MALNLMTVWNQGCETNLLHFIAQNVQFSVQGNFYC